MTSTPSDIDTPGTTAKPLRVLLVEDERLVAMSLQRQLQVLGYEVVGWTPSGSAAIERADALRPDVVLMDIYLEGDVDGISAADEIQKQFQLPVIYLTAFSNREVLDRAKITEPAGYILKPYEGRELQVAIEMAVYRHRAEEKRLVTLATERRQVSLATPADDGFSYISRLTPREREVMHLIVSGKTQKQIAAQLDVTIQTAAKHRAKVLQKVNVSNDVELTRVALANQIGAENDGPIESGATA
jgi:DNA-binding NarL/FixJ family response regulator